MYQQIKTLPEILSHQPKSAEKSPSKIIKVCKSEIWIWWNFFITGVVFWALSMNISNIQFPGLFSFY